MNIDIVIPAYNEEALIGDCLASVIREVQRTQSARPGFLCKIVVVNNASTDRTKEIANGFPGIRVIDEMKKGLVYARNAGHSITSHDLVAHVDSDTIMPEGWLDTVIDSFEDDPELVALSGPYYFYDLTPLKRGGISLFYGIAFLAHHFNHTLLRRSAVLQGGNFVIRRDAWAAAGGFDTSITFHGEDTDVARRISKHGRVRWTFKLPMHSSGRRIEREGLLKTAFIYSLNFLSTSIVGKPFIRAYQDIRTKKAKPIQ